MATGSGKYGRSEVFWKKSNVLKSDLKESSDGFCRGGRGRSCNVEGPKTKKKKKKSGTKSDTRNLEAEGIRNRAKSTGGCVKLTEVSHRNKME